MSKSKILINSIDAFIFDFDGVLTNNKVLINEKGEELVICSRADGLAFDVLKKLSKPSYIISTEKNQVVRCRGKKLGIKVFQNVSNKPLTLKKLVKKEGYDLKKIFYIGNDINDYKVMKISGYTACPKDAHPIIKSISDFTLKTKGGDGVVRELIEKIIKIDLLKTLYSEV